LNIQSPLSNGPRDLGSTRLLANKRSEELPFGPVGAEQDSKNTALLSPREVRTGKLIFCNGLQVFGWFDALPEVALRSDLIREYANIADER